ncbi:PREDICTED: transcription factor SOX-13 [Cyprinodon variegatus]|uniref:transcription factor SOX-13 n=1 Tax=Cyprinodon variegatus TaxID=28743 RepID=UPI0007425C5A|nr:PREDICTED: transcription factor SOX-13 [Cyprinodon variegatus]
MTCVSRTVPGSERFWIPALPAGPTRMVEPSPSALHLLSSGDAHMAEIGVKVEQEECNGGGGAKTSSERPGTLQEWSANQSLEARQLTPPLSRSPSEGSPGKELPHKQSPLGGKEAGIHEQSEAQSKIKEVMPNFEKLLKTDWKEKLLDKSTEGAGQLRGTPESLAEKELQLLMMINQLSGLREQLLNAHSEQRNMAALLLEKQQQQMEVARRQQEEIAKQQELLIKQQRTINQLQQQIQVNMPFLMIPAFHPNSQPLPVTSESQMTYPVQPIPCKPAVDYPIQLLQSSHPASIKRSTTSFRQEASQPLNLTSKPKGMEVGKTSSPQSLELGSLGLQGGYRFRDLHREASHSPPRPTLSFLGEGDVVTQAIHDAQQLLRSHSRGEKERDGAVKMEYKSSPRTEKMTHCEREDRHGLQSTEDHLSSDSEAS